MPQAAKPRSKPEPTSAPTLTDAPPAADGAGVDTTAPPGAKDGHDAPLLTLPDTRSVPSGKLEDKTILVYGPAKIGKSTLASELGDYLFLDCEGGLGELEVFRVPVTSWLEFGHWCKAYAAKPGKYPGLVIDTIDKLALYCSEYTLKQLQIAHESDAEYGKAYRMVRNNMERALAKLAAMSESGLVLISHSNDVEIKTRNQTYTRSVPTLTGQIKDSIVNLADIVLFVDYEIDGEGEERRVIRTKPSRHWEAGERGKSPRLPALLEWPMGHGGEALRQAWYGA